MESQIIQVFLRILYTINNNPQYILAKSSSQVSAVVCGGTTAQSQFDYARAPLKACLAAMCDSSPELLPQDPMRDFSIYVLDPLEAQPLPASLAHTPQNSSSPRGVAVALGLMSWALGSTGSPEVFVAGTIVPNASPALEIVFALRETKRVPKPLHSYPPSSSTSTSFPCHPLNHPQSTQAGTSSMPIVQQPQTLTCSADFPEFYIGPPRRAPGRPEGSTSSKSRLKSQAGASSRGAGVKQAVGEGFKKKTRPKPPRAPPTYSPFICEPLTRNAATPNATATSIPAFHPQSHALSSNQTQPHPQLHAQHQQYPNTTCNPLLQLLSTIPSTSNSTATNATPGQQAALVAALQALLTANPQLLQLAATSMGASASSGEKSIQGDAMAEEIKVDNDHNDGDPDIVILDSSAVDTAAFRKPGPRKFAPSADTSSLTTKQESPIPGIPSMDSSPLPASTPPSGQEGTPASSETLTPMVTPQMQTPSLKQVYSGRTDEGHITPMHGLELPETPSPFRTRKRKLDEYVEGEPYSSPSPPPSPSPSVTRASSGATTAKRILSSPTAGTKSMSSPSMRLPSVLNSIHSLATLSSRLHASSSTRGNWPLNKNEYPSSVPGPSSSRADHPRSTDAPLNDTSLLKRRRTLNEVMEEREARKHIKDRKRLPSGQKIDMPLSKNTSQSVFALPANVVLAPRHAQSSPPRPLFRTEWMASLRPPSTYRSGLASADPPATTPVARAPPKGVPTTCPTENPLKNFVVPAWARTNTATRPRLSEDTLARQRAEQEAKKARVSMRRREAAKAKRKRLRGAEQPSKDSSDEGEDVTANDPKPRSVYVLSSVGRGAPLLSPPPPSLPVFASDAVEPIPSSPPQLHCQLAFPVVPSTPPRKTVSPVSAPHRTPSRSGSCSLFTPSNNDYGRGSLFTPSTPSATQSLARVNATPRSPTVLHYSGPRKTPRNGAAQTPRTPKHSGLHHHTPRSLRSGRHTSLGSPSLAMRTPLGTRAFLLPPPSPCTSRAPQPHNRTRTIVPEKSSPIGRMDVGTSKQELPSDRQQHADRGKDAFSREPDDVPLPGDVSIAPGPSNSALPTVDKTGEPAGMTSPNDDDLQEDERYPSSPLPPSSPIPASPLSSPTKDHDSDAKMPIIDSLAVPDSDVLLPSASDSDGSQRRKVDMNWLSDDACTASWFTESDASAWLTETEAWLTDADLEGGAGPLVTDSDGTWLSDSEAVFGDMSSLPRSSASNWFSDDADVNTDAEGGGREGALDASAFELAFSALVEWEGQVRNAVGGEEGAKEADADFWSMIRPLLGNGLADPGMASGEGVEETKVAEDAGALMQGPVK